MNFMFAGAQIFNSDLSRWDVGNVSNMIGMFDNSGLSRNNYDAILIGWAQQEVVSNVKLGAKGVTFCIGQDARQNLIDENEWYINDAGHDCTSIDVYDEKK